MRRTTHPPGRQPRRTQPPDPSPGRHRPAAGPRHARRHPARPPTPRPSGTTRVTLHLRSAFLCDRPGPSTSSESPTGKALRHIHSPCRPTRSTSYRRIRASELVYLDVDEEEQWRRVQARALTDAASTFEMTKADLEWWRQIFQPPDATEIGTADLDPSPAGFDSWEAWVAQWWPTSLFGSGSAQTGARLTSDRWPLFEPEYGRRRVSTGPSVRGHCWPPCRAHTAPIR